MRVLCACELCVFTRFCFLPSHFPHIFGRECTHALPGFALLASTLGNTLVKLKGRHTGPCRTGMACRKRPRVAPLAGRNATPGQGAQEVPTMKPCQCDALYLVGRRKRLLCPIVSDWTSDGLPQRPVPPFPLHCQ